MAEFWVTVKIEGTAACMVEADNAEDAEKMARESGEWEINDWELNTQSWKGGYIEATEHGK